MSEVINKRNNIIIDIDFIRSDLVYYYNDIKPLKGNDGIYKNIDEYFDKRINSDVEWNPYVNTFELDAEYANRLYNKVNNNSKWIASHKLMCISAYNIIKEFISSSFVNVTFAINNETDEKILKELFNEVDNPFKCIFKSEEKEISLDNYDTLYIKGRDDIKYYNLSDVERRTVYVTNLRYNFIDDNKEILHYDFLSFGLKNDIEVIEIYY